MASLIYLDTHVVVWLHEEGGAAVPAASARLIEETLDVRISPMVRMELQYLYEIDRISEPPLPVLDTLESLLGLTICHAPFPAIIKETESQNWTRDPFDRIIVAQAALYSATLITKDESIHKHYSKAFWT